MNDYIASVVALQSAMIARKQEIDKSGMAGFEYDVLCRDVDALEIIKQDLMTVYGMDTRRSSRQIEREKRIAENAGKNPF